MTEEYTNHWEIWTGREVEEAGAVRFIPHWPDEVQARGSVYRDAPAEYRFSVDVEIELDAGGWGSPEEAFSQALVQMMDALIAETARLGTLWRRVQEQRRRT